MAVSEEECSSAKSRASPSNNRTHYLAKCVLRGSVVLQVVYGHIRSPTMLDVVFGKETSIELVIIGEDGIVQSVCEQPVFGIIKDLAILPWNEKFRSRNQKLVGRDLLIVTSDSGKLSFLYFCNEMHRFFPMTQVQLSNPGNSRNQLGRMLAVDSSGCYIATSAYENQLAMFSISASARSDIIDKKIVYPLDTEGDVSEAKNVQDNRISGTIWSMCFISKDPIHQSQGHNPLLAILLNRRRSLLNELLILEWNIKENNIFVISQYVDAGPLAYSIVEIPYCYGFALMFRAGDFVFMDLRDPRGPACVHRTNLKSSPDVEEQNFVEDSCKITDVDDEGLFNVAACALLELGDYDPMCIDGDKSTVESTYKHVCSWSWEPLNTGRPRLIFCVDSGEFFLIEFFFDSNGFKTVHQSDCLYKGLACKGLQWVEGGFIAALIEMGDGMVLKLENESLLYSSPIQNIAPILDMSVVDYHGETHDQMFACCGVAPEGSMRIIRSGISMEKLLRTAPIYEGITGTWTVEMKVTDSYHSFLVLSFVEETRVLSVGLSFTDVTDSVGFQSNVCTLACGLVNDGLLIQIHQEAVRLCLPTKLAHCEGIPLPSPICTSWFPDNMNINLGAVGHDQIVVSTSNPCIFFILGVRLLSAYHYEIYEMQHLSLQYELSCVSIPPKYHERRSTNHHKNMVDTSHPHEVDISKCFVVGTHKPSVEILTFDPDEGLKLLAIGTITLTNTLGTPVSGCIPQDVRIVLVDHFYVLSGLRNGMLLRFEWPATLGFLANASTVLSSMSTQDSFGLYLPNDVSTHEFPVNLQVIAIRRIGITPVFLVPLSNSLDADIIALSDRPWLLHTARHGLSYTSISFQSSTHVTAVCSVDCPKGILFVADNSLHLVEMVLSKRLNVQKFTLEGTPRKVLCHSESKLLLVLRTDLTYDTCSSDVCCLDPLSGVVLSSFKFDLGETGKAMEFVRAGNEQVLIIGTSLSSGPVIMPSGEAESTKGRLIVLCLEHVQNSDNGSLTLCSKAGSSSQRSSPFREVAGYAAEQLSSSSLCSSPDDTSCEGLKFGETDVWQFRLSYSVVWPGMVLAICPYLDGYFLASAGNAFYVCGFSNDNSHRVRKFAVVRTRFMITCLTAHFTRIAVGDSRDGILFYSYHEDARKLEQVYCDPLLRLVADCILMDTDTAIVSDRKGSIAVLSCSNYLEDNASPECNLTVSCAYYVGEIAMSIRKGSFSYKFPADGVLSGSNVNLELSHNTIITSTLLGSIITYIPLSREEYELLEAVQARLVVHPLTAPILGNDHNEFHSRENPIEVPKILDGDMLTQFLELTSIQQEAVLSFPLGTKGIPRGSLNLSSTISVNQVVQLLERVHYALN